MTGLSNFVTLMCMFNFVSSFIQYGHMSKMTAFQNFVMVLMNLRLGSPFKHLAIRFGVSESVISRSFGTVLHFMYKRFKPLIFWPERE